MKDQTPPTFQEIAEAFTHDAIIAMPDNVLLAHASRCWERSDPDFALPFKARTAWVAEFIQCMHEIRARGLSF